jgi:hypothetical protein
MKVEISSDEKLMRNSRVNPGGVALKSSAEVDAEVIHVSVRTTRSS